MTNPENTSKASIRENTIDVIAFISDSIEGEYVSAQISRPRSMELSQEELIDELHENVWWLSREEIMRRFMPSWSA